MDNIENHMTSKIDSTPFLLTITDYIIYGIFFICVFIILCFIIYQILKHIETVKYQNEIRTNQEKSFIERNLK